MTQVETFAENVIDAERLSSNQSLTIPQAPEPDGGDVVDSVVAESRMTAQQQVSQAKDQAETATAESKSQLQGRISEMLGLQQERARQEEDAGIPKLSQEIADITSQIEGKEHAFRRRIEELQRQPGLTKDQVNARVSDLQRRTAFELADLSIIQNARLRNMEALQTSIDRRISLAMEGLQFQLQFDKMFYEENRNALTKQEDREFQLRIQTEEREYNEEMMKQQQIGQVAMTAAQYGANATQIGEIFSSDTLEGAVASGSQFLGAGFALQVDAHIFQQDMQRASHALQRESFEFQKDVFAINQQQAEEQRMLEMIEMYRQMDIDARKEVKNTEEYEEWRVRSRRLEDVNQAAISHLGVDLNTQSPDWEKAAESDAFVDTVAAALFYTENPTARRPQEMDATEAAFFNRQVAKIKKEMGGENITPNLLRQQVERLNSLTHASSISLDNQLRAISLEYGVNLESVDGAILSQDKAFLDGLMSGGSNFDLLQLEQQFIHE